MKRFLIITVSVLVLLHAFVAWIHVSYPHPDPAPTIRLWQQGYVEAGLLASAVGWFLFVLGIYVAIRFIRRRRHYVDA